MSESAFDWLSAAELSKLFSRGEASPVEVLDAMLKRAAALQPHLNALVLIDKDGAQAAAKAAESRWRKGEPLSPLDGIPTTIKDTTNIKGWPTRYGSHSTDETPAPDNAAVTDRLLAAGMIIFGKSATPEFGWKALTDSPLQGFTRNPWNLAHSPGGSSGGASSLTAAGINPFNHGNDGGGSIRIPASHTGLVGLKPSYGRIPQYPADAPFADVISQGVLARSVLDTAMALNVTAGPDPRDWRSLPTEARDYTVGLDAGVRGWKIGLSLDLGHVKADPEVRELVAAAARRFEELGAHVEEVGPMFESLQEHFEPLWIGSFATRFRQIPTQLHDKLDPGLRALMEKGLAITLADYAKAFEARSRLARDLALWHRNYDLLLAPVAPTAGPPVETLYNSEAFPRWTKGAPYTLPCNLTGQPAASMPAGLTSAGLPVGIQIIGPPRADDVVLRAMRAFESATGWTWPQPKVLETLKGL
ncbi:amidase [Reyranella sp.]|jgi:aspartyl-tRNA(Asn)/glutamyl-tRNA(Gln) amidotransferase subunit A|uniref:amidase n=1 Tax=Reyranella sp. TaxID=1929291 RepID=UPI000BD58C08|nr:amidase [Reyranella sp.]OYY46901.1 MAG: amidase [Rhodospirillales bacterium 35-66-84]OYZ96921.1 MAG: amidase [Rhodospirillales bacterium 24-66-33]OZB27750.1 MAG: amidase [Rhodospirillales bacterium 39-66-50]HQS13821.1 amidase [Reyranella sp.]HQT10306.1 amidase [Reyranella sp.]